MTREEALRTYTIWAAYAEFAEEIWKIQVLKTVIAGQTVFPAKP